MTGLQISATVEEFMRKPEFVQGSVFSYVEKNLMGLDLLPKINADGRSYTYYAEKTSMGSSTKKVKPKEVTASSKFPEIEITRMQSASGMLNRKGYKAVLDRDAILLNKTDDLDRAMRHLGFWLAYDLNTDVFDTLTDGGTADGVSHSDWSGADVNIIDELRQTVNAMDRDGYAYSASDIYLNKDQWVELQEYLFFTDYTSEKQNRLLGWPTPNGDTITIPGLGVDVVKARTGIDAGSLLCLDNDNPAATYYYNVDPMYGSMDITYQTKVDGQVVTKTTQNPGLNVSIYMENDTRLLNIDAWMDYGIGMQEPYAALVGTGI